MVICLEQGADLHMAQLMPLPLTVSCFRKIQIGFTFLVPAHLGSPGKRAVKRVCVCVCVMAWHRVLIFFWYRSTPLLGQSLKYCYYGSHPVCYVLALQSALESLLSSKIDFAAASTDLMDCSFSCPFSPSIFFFASIKHVIFCV